MEYSYLLIEENNGITKIVINNPKNLNALNSKILTELGDAIEKIENNNNTRVLIITGEGKSFVAGADITEMKDLDSLQGKKFGELGSKVFRNIETLKIPVIAAINGFALGGGCELALACDIRIASDNAKFGQPEVGLGIIPGFSGTQRLPKIIGIGKAKELIYTGEVIDAQKALEIGLVNKVIPKEELLTYVQKLAEKIAINAPIAVKYAKEAINIGSNLDINSGIALENNLFGLCFSTTDQKEGMKAFVNKEKYLFKNK